MTFYRVLCSMIQAPVPQFSSFSSAPREIKAFFQGGDVELD